MTIEDKQFLEENRWAVQSYSEESPPRKMRMMDRERLLKIVQENIDPKFTTDMWCDKCERSFILNAYLMYDKYLADEPK